MINHYGEMTSTPYLMVHVYSSFAAHKIYDLCEEKDTKQVIKLK